MAFIGKGVLTIVAHVVFKKVISLENELNIIGHFKRFWRFHSLVLGALSISALTLGCAMHEPAYYEGTWVVTAAHPPVETTQHTTQPNVAQLGVAQSSAAQPSEFLGSSVVYSSVSARLDQYLCEAPTYTERTIAPSAIELDYKVSYASLGFSNDKISLVELSCSNDGVSIGSQLLYQENTLAYTHVDGTFLKLEKAVF